MIRMFIKEDLETIEENMHADLKLFRREANNYSDKYTLVDNGIPIVIILGINYVGNNYHGGFIVSKNIRMKHIKELKTALWSWMEDNGVERFETVSIDEPKVNKWHEFLGLHQEGVKEKFAFGKDYISWAWVK